jgi:hypothetical protein
MARFRSVPETVVTVTTCCPPCRTSPAIAGPVWDQAVITQPHQSECVITCSICDYQLGGKDHFAADRETGDEAIRAYPDMRSSVRANRAFLSRSVRYLTEEAGIRQFLDVGTGLPSASNTHEVAQAAAPESRVVYVDNDPSRSSCMHGGPRATKKRPRGPACGAASPGNPDAPS